MRTQRAAIHKHLISPARKPAEQTTGTAQLTYYIFEGVLAGFVGPDAIFVTAWSGGGGGSTRNATQESANHPYFYGLKTSGPARSKNHVHGGPIPPGRYRIHPPSTHKKLGLSCFLEPSGKLPNHRDGFFFHKQGPHGSDGCIVIPDDNFEGVMAKLKASQGGRLHVLQAMDGAFA